MKKGIFLVAILAFMFAFATPEVALAKSKKAKSCCETTAKDAKCSTEDKEKCKADSKACCDTKATKSSKKAKVSESKETKDSKATAK